jgi:FAD/FMN-containing dehydrogenase
LALDNLLGVELVLADGSLVTADAATNPELFWALRGGGGNFGVVTAMRIRLHPLRELLAGLILFPWHEAEAVLRGYAALAASQPDDFAVSLGITSGPDGGPLLHLAPSWTGVRSEGEAIIARLQGLGKPVWAQIASMTCGEMLGMFDERVVNGRHNAVETRWVSALTPQVIALLVAGGAAKTSPFAAILLQHFRGAAARVPVDATAFGLRREHFLIVIVATWEADAGDAAKEAARHREWAERLSLALALTPAAVPGGYPNLLGSHQRDRAALAYGYKIVRLQRAKQRFDPDGVFASATPLPP